MFICSKLVPHHVCHIRHPSSPSRVPPSGSFESCGNEIGFYPPTQVMDVEATSEDGMGFPP